MDKIGEVVQTRKSVCFQNDVCLLLLGVLSTLFDRALSGKKKKKNLDVLNWRPVALDK